jgi:hypothetical protein
MLLKDSCKKISCSQLGFAAGVISCNFAIGQLLVKTLDEMLELEPGEDVGDLVHGGPIQLRSSAVMLLKDSCYRKECLEELLQLEPGKNKRDLVHGGILNSCGNQL